MTANPKPALRFKGFDEAWISHLLGDIGVVAMNKRIFKNQTTEDGDVPFFKIGTFGGEPDAYISRELFEEYKQKYSYPEKGDLLISASGSIGNIVEYSGEDQYFQDSNIVWLNHQGKIDNSFLKVFYAIVKWSGLEGSTLKRLYNKNILETDISIPKTAEQEKIGEYFQKLDGLIAQHQKKHDKLLKVKKSLLEHMFPKKEKSLPDIRYKGFVQKWEICALGDQAIVKGRLGWKSLKQHEYLNDGPSMIAGKHISNGKIDWECVDHIPMWRYLESPEIMLRNGDVIFSKDGALGNPAIIKNLKNYTTINSTMMLVRSGDRLNSDFFIQVLKSKRFEDLLKLKVSGSSIPHLFQGDMKAFEYEQPDYKEQEKIGKLFEKLDGLIAQHEKQLKKLKNIKQACLAKMFV